jgi:peptide/nickel transport system permease protein
VTSLAFARAPIQTFRQMSSAVGIVTRRPLGAVGLAIVVLFVFLGLFGPWLAPYDPNVINVRARLESPSWLHWLGTDQLGRDTLSRLLVGTRVAFLVAFISIAITAAIGVSAGLASGLGPRWLDRILVTIFDTVRSFPMLMFGIAVIALFGPSLWTIIAIIVISTFPIYARITRTQTMAIKSSEFILAERSIGVGSLRIAVMHIFPNIAGQILVLMSMDVPVVIMVESGLSFLGLGIRPPNASWGTILNDGYAFIRDTSWPVLAGGVPLILATIGFTFLGETLRDLLDPKLRRSF